MKGELVLNSNDYLPLRDVVFQTLRQSILTGQMEPGERLMEVQLAEELGVSRTPVREAIRMLELEGLVVMIPRRGAQVAAITKQDLRDVLEVRATLERLAARLACERFTEEGYRNLEKANREFAHLARLRNKSVVDITNADVHFHDVIYQATGNRRLIQIVQNLQEQMYRYRMEYVRDLSSHENLIAEHTDIIRALEARDETKAEEIVVTHISNQAKEILRLINEHEEDRREGQQRHIEGD